MSLVTSFPAYPDSEGGTHNVGGVDGELHQAVLISGSIGVIVRFICCDEDEFIWHGDPFPIHEAHLKIKSSGSVMWRISNRQQTYLL